MRCRVLQVQKQEVAAGKDQKDRKSGFQKTPHARNPCIGAAGAALAPLSKTRGLYELQVIAASLVSGFLKWRKFLQQTCTIAIEPGSGCTRAIVVGGERLHFYGIADHSHSARVHDHVARCYLRMRQRFRNRIDRPGGHARRLEQLQPVRGTMLRENAFDQACKLFGTAAPVVVAGEARVVCPVRLAEGRA